MRGIVIGSFMGCQRGKHDIALDLKQPDGAAHRAELVATADIVHHNMTLGTADRLGIGYEHCKAVRPDILYCNAYMYGAVGPARAPRRRRSARAGRRRTRVGGGPVAEGNPPLWYRYGHGDAAGAMTSVNAVLMALYHRNRTGEGQNMWTSMLHGTMLYTADSWLAADGTPSPRPTLDREQLGLDASLPALRDARRMAPTRGRARGALAAALPRAAARGSRRRSLASRRPPTAPVPRRAHRPCSRKPS